MLFGKNKHTGTVATCLPIRLLHHYLGLYQAVRRRLKDKGLDLHPEKTKIVYCKDDRRRGDHDHQAFDFLSYTFRARSVKTRDGVLRVGFVPAISEKAKKGIRDEVRDWRLVATMNNKSLEEIARFINPIVRGWVNYYGHFYRSECLATLNYLNLVLVQGFVNSFNKSS